ncbi:MAG TPA: ABC transporter substrate-binding protein [Clostridia bacterium]|nr:ABC transporter substrate-binding protein [Clostridia bacterium]
MKRTMVFLFAALFLVATLTSACTSAPKEAEPIKIGIFEPLTGANAAGGQMELEGIKVAHSIKGEVLGRKIVLVEMDNKSDDVEAVTAAERLVNEEKVAVVVGSWGSSVCIAAGPTFEAAKIPAIGTSCTNPLVTLDNDYYFRVCYLDDFQGTLLANFAKQNGYMKAGVIVDVSDTYAIGLRNFFVEAYGKDNIVAEAKFNKGDQDFTAQITTVMAANPDVIFAPSGYTEAGLMMAQARQMGYNDVLFLGGDTWETEAMIEVGGAATEACRFTTFFDADAEPTAESKQFLEAYDKMFGGKPKGAVTALGYDAYMAAVAAIEKAGSTDGVALQKALTELDIVGVTGRCTFDENGDGIKNQAIIKTVEGGAFKYVTTVVVD